MTSAYEDARERGGLGPSGVQLLYETVDAVRRIRSFPPPPGYQAWTSDAVLEVAHDFLAPHANETDRIFGVLLRATDDESFERLLEAAVRNFMRSELRKTDRGSAMRALRRIVDGDSQVVVVPAGQPAAGAWCLPAQVGVFPYSGDPTRLVDAAFAVDDVRRVRWRADARNRAPIGERDSVQRIVRAVLAEAGSPVPRSQMLAIVLLRLPLIDSPSFEELADGIEDEAPTEVDSASSLLAAEIWSELDDRERLVVALLDETARDAAAETGLSKSAAHRAMTSARSALAERIADEADRLSVLAGLRQFSISARARGTERAGLAFTRTEED